MMYPQAVISGLVLLLLAAVDSFPEVHGVVGHPVTLPCTYPVSKGLSSVCWGRGACASDTCGQTLIWTDGYRIYYGTNNRYQLKGQLLQGDVSLTIENVTESDSGLYCCQVEMKGWDGAQRLTTSLQVQPGVPTSSSRRLTTTSRFKPTNRPRPTPTSPITTLRKPRITLRRPRITPKKPKTTKNSKHPIKPTPTSKRPSTTTKSTTTLRRPSITTKSITTSRRPATTLKPISTSRRSTITTRSQKTTPRRPSTITKPTTTPRRPPPTIKPTTTPRTALTTTKSTPTPRKPETTSVRPTTTTKYTITSTRLPNAPTSTRISAPTPPTPVHTQTPKPVYTDTVTSSQRPWNNDTEVVPTPKPPKITNKSLYISISVSVVLLLLMIILITIKCRHMRKKRKPQVISRCDSIVFHDYKKEAFGSTVQPQAEDTVYIIEDILHPRIDSQLPSKMTSFRL